MAIISYSQNLEDVMLWRALKEIKNGFYIDVGANDPEIDSVTKLFYDNGWSGINIEPLDQHYRELLKQRKRDINLKCGAGSKAGEFEIWECDKRGWATMDKVVAAEHERNGFQGQWHKIPIQTLTEICSEHISSDIHFLKIDVEGVEKSVIEGLDLSNIRPWIIVIEATKPATSIENHDVWEHLITEQAYLHAYSDGLNRFYVASEKKGLLEALKYPPNIFDQYITKKELVITQKLQAFDTKYQQAVVKAEQADAKAKQAEVLLDSIQTSLSWKITMPLRKINQLIKILKFYLDTKISLILLHLKLYINRRRFLKKILGRFLKKFPGLLRFVNKTNNAELQIQKFEDLLSVKIMKNVSQVSNKDQSVIFLEINKK